MENNCGASSILAGRADMPPLVQLTAEVVCSIQTGGASKTAGEFLQGKAFFTTGPGRMPGQKGKDARLPRAKGTSHIVALT